MGEILEVRCQNCLEKKQFIVGEGMSLFVEKLYHCPICYFIKTKRLQYKVNTLSSSYKTSKTENLFNTQIVCEQCKKEKKNNVMSEIHEEMIENLKCFKCGKKQLKTFLMGHWD